MTLPFTVENLRRVLTAISPLRPRFYQSMGQPLGDRTGEDLATFRNLYLETELGIIDMLGQVPPLGDYATLAARAKRVELFGRECRILSLDDLIAVKEFVRRPKDLLVATELRAIREQNQVAKI
ncbi:MAG: hypothetical protein K1X64_21340 [Myxococcaceae bacterium]|nr:hypothetical protein [Myxococcaceae bacterium]